MTCCGKQGWSTSPNIRSGKTFSIRDPRLHQSAFSMTGAVTPLCMVISLPPHQHRVWVGSLLCGRASVMADLGTRVHNSLGVLTDHFAMTVGTTVT